MLFNSFDEAKKYIDYNSIKKYSNYFKFLITNIKDIHLDGFKTIESIDIIEQIDPKAIEKCIFFLYFETDDEYIYHLDKIYKNNGKLISICASLKKNYKYSNKNCNNALKDTLTKNDIISHYDERIHSNICQAIEQTKNLKGCYVEIGVYKGGSALTALNYMKHSGINKKCYFFDTFEGFDYEEAYNSTDTVWASDGFEINKHKLWGKEETIKKINDLLSTSCPNQEFKLIASNICKDELPSEIEEIVVANIDVDMLEATYSALEKVGSKIVKGGIIIAEDPIATPYLIGAFYAMEKFLKTNIGKKFMKLHLGTQYFLIKIHE